MPDHPPGQGRIGGQATRQRGALASAQEQRFPALGRLTRLGGGSARYNTDCVEL